MPYEGTVYMQQILDELASMVKNFEACRDLMQKYQVTGRWFVHNLGLASLL